MNAGTGRLKGECSRMRALTTGPALLVCLLALAAGLPAAEPPPVAGGADMIVWEHQNWESNGGFERLTLWSDGCSEVVVAPLAYARDDQRNLQPNSGWELIRYQSPPHIEFTRTGIYPPEVAQAKFRAALAAGIDRIESFQPGYVDGGGTRIVIMQDGRQREIVVPVFTDREQGTSNYKRFLAVSEILGGFDRNAYTVVGETGGQ